MECTKCQDSRPINPAFGGAAADVMLSLSLEANECDRKEGMQVETIHLMG